jgi:hypothetical protein
MEVDDDEFVENQKPGSKSRPFAKGAIGWGTQQKLKMADVVEPHLCAKSAQRWGTHGMNSVSDRHDERGRPSTSRLASKERTQSWGNQRRDGS